MDIRNNKKINSKKNKFLNFKIKPINTIIKVIRDKFSIICLKL